MIDKGYKLVPISVNISRNDISGVGHDPRMLAERIIRIIKEYDIDPKYIIIEVTETTEASEQKDLYDFIKNMSEAGIATSIDDFGTAKFQKKSCLLLRLNSLGYDIQIQLSCHLNDTLNNDLILC